MRTPYFIRTVLAWSMIIVAAPAFGSIKLVVRDGRPIVDGVFVNGHGPYRFLLDTGSNVNLMETSVARKIGMTTTFQVALGSAAGSAATPGSDGNEIVLDQMKAVEQKFLISPLDAIHETSPDVQGVLGQWFLGRFDYTLNLKRKELDFGSTDSPGPHTPFRWINARPVVSTSLGNLALDSGQTALVLFGLQSDGPAYQLHTVGGSQFVGKASGKALLIDGRRISDGDAIAIPDKPEADVDGLLPLGLFKLIYVCNSEGYVIFE